jgi:hypothetical protein
VRRRWCVFPPHGGFTLRHVEFAGVAKPRCPETGLNVPECSCTRCLEAMLREVQPTLLEAEIKVTRLRPPGPDTRADERHKAA